MDARRSQRVTGALHEELSEMISYELSDPRLIGVSVVDVHVSPDAKKARVVIAVDGGSEEKQQALDALENARYYLKQEISRRITLFRVPELHFEAGVAPELEAKMGHLFKRIRKGRPRAGAEPQKSPLE